MMPAPDAAQAETLLATLTQQIKTSLQARPRPMAIVGIHTGGVWVAERLHAALALSSPLSTLSSAFHRDDYSKKRGFTASSSATDIAIDVQDASILLVDDILFTGRTVRAALNELFDYGRPREVELAVLLDRGGRELPVAATYCGAALVPPGGSSFVLSKDTQGRLHLGVE